MGRCTRIRLRSAAGGFSSWELPRRPPGLAACATPIPSLTLGPSPSSTALAITDAIADSEPHAGPDAATFGRAAHRPRPVPRRRAGRRPAPTLQRNVSILVDDGAIAWIRPDRRRGGSRRRGRDRLRRSDVRAGHGRLPQPRHRARAARTGSSASTIRPRRSPRSPSTTAGIGLAAGVRWMRDVGSPIGVDPEDGRERALALGVRDRWVGSPRPSLPARGRLVALQDRRGTR